VLLDDPATMPAAGAVAPSRGRPSKKRTKAPKPAKARSPQRPNWEVEYPEPERPNAGSRESPRGPRRGRHSIRRLHVGRLVVLIAVAIVASAGVAIASPTLMPAEPTEMMSDPAFDATAFYQTHPNVAAGHELAFAFAPGLPTQPKPVAGLTQAATNNAYIVVEVGRSMKLPERAYVVAIATALQETFLKNLANSRVPESLKLEHEGVETNFDSLGIFQQRPSQGWGSAKQLMDPAEASARFYAKLIRVPNWQKLSVANAAQAVQRSAFPSAYAKHVDHAEEIVSKLPSYS
jgi:hypothetical protein